MLICGSRASVGSLFCWSLGRKPLQRGLMVLGGGALVTFVTLLFMPSERVVFGVLTMLGSSILLMIPLEKLLQKVPAAAGLAAGGVCFFLTRNVNHGYLGFEGMNLIKLPEGFYQNLFTTYLGFQASDFFSTDYFSLIPWLFLFVSGYFLYRLCAEKGWLAHKAFRFGIKPLSFIGRHSLLIYLVHQPILYGMCYLFFG